MLQQGIVNAKAIAEIHRKLGISLHGLGKLEEAVDSFNMALSIKPNLASASDFREARKA